MNSTWLSCLRAPGSAPPTRFVICLSTLRMAWHGVRTPCPSPHRDAQEQRSKLRLISPKVHYKRERTLTALQVRILLRSSSGVRCPFPPHRGVQDVRRVIARPHVALPLPCVSPVLVSQELGDGSVDFLYFTDAESAHEEDIAALIKVMEVAWGKLNKGALMVGGFPHSETGEGANGFARGAKTPAAWKAVLSFTEKRGTQPMLGITDASWVIRKP